MSFPTIQNIIVNGLSNLVDAFNRLQTQLSTFVDAINRKPQLDSITLYNISLVAGNNQIPHTLGKVLTGWKLIDITAPATISRSAPSTNLSLFLNSSAATTISLEVF